MLWRKALGIVVELVVVLLVVSFGVFALVSLMGGDPAITILGEGRTEAEYQEIRDQLGLGQPLLVRYLGWLGAALTGNLGTMLVAPFSPVVDRVAQALPVSAELAILGLVIALVIAVPLAMLSAYRPGGRIDRIISVGSFGMLSIPSFLLGLLLIALFVNTLGWFPRAEWVPIGEGIGPNLAHAILPAMVIAIGEAATYTRILRNDLIGTLQEDYILASRAKGLGVVQILFGDALRPASLSMVTIVGISIGRLIGSTVIVEHLFALPGMGSLVVSAAYNGDFATVQGGVLVIAVIYVLVNAFIDITYGWLDPRIRRAHV